MLAGAGADVEGGVDASGPWGWGTAPMVSQLAQLASGLKYWEGGRLDVDSLPGRGALEAFLRALHEVGRAMRVEAAPRTYRNTLSDRARATWTDRQCPYGIHMMTESVHGAVYLNSREHPLSDEAKLMSGQLFSSMTGICRLLGQLRRVPQEGWQQSDEDELRSGLVAFDTAWASFEERFFEELPAIEAEARSVLVESVDLVNALDRIAGGYGDDVDPKMMLENPEFVERHKDLINCISRLNRTANPNNKGSIFTLEVLHEAEAVVEEGFASGDDTDANGASPAFVLAKDAVLAWDDLCCYLYQVTQYVDLLSPELSKNKDLVKLLAGWESAWVLAAKYVLDQNGRFALCNLVKYIEKAKAIAPGLGTMIDERSAEFFMVLPRLVWLSFLEDPMAMERLISPLLPHRFEDISEESGESQHGISHGHHPELLRLMDDYRRLWNVLVPVVANGNVDSQAGVVGVLTSSVVVGISNDAETLPFTDSPVHQRAKAACKSFVHNLEKWSIELQRHSPTDWNRFSALLMRCVNPPDP